MFSRCLKDGEEILDEIFKPDESSRHPTPSVDDSLRNKLSLIEDDSSMDMELVSMAIGNKQTPDAAIDTEVERTFTGDDLPTNPDDLSVEMTKQETLSPEVVSTELTPKPVKMDSTDDDDDECVITEEMAANDAGELMYIVGYGKMCHFTFVHIFASY